MHKAEDFVRFLFNNSQSNARIYPVDREFLEPYLDAILSLDVKEFLYYNFQLQTSLYTCRLFACLPELWRRVSLDDLLHISNQFTSSYSYFVLVEFTYKYIEINILRSILESRNIQQNPTFRTDLVNYLKNQSNTLIKSPSDYEDFEDGFINVEYEEWLYVKQLFLIDKRVEPALKDQEKLRLYINQITAVN